jgi:plastocyanin
MRSLSFFTVCLALTACTTTPTPADSGNGGTDTGSPPVDTGSPPVDTGSPPVDTGAPPVDTGTPPVDTGTPVADAGGECHDDYSGCTSLEDMTSASTVTIANVGFSSYDHHCIRIAAGTMVTITNSSIHPLHAASCSTAGGPIPSTPAADPSGMTTYTFATAGRYGYYCNVHGADIGTGMAGLIVVE